VVVVEQGRGRVGEDDLAVLQHVAPVGDLQRVEHVLLDDQHGGAGPRDPVDHREDLRHHDRREAEGGLVGHQELGPRHHPAGDGHHLLLAPGQGAGVLVEALAHPREQVEDVRERLRLALARGAAVGARQQVLPHRHLGEELAPLRDQGDAPRHHLVA